jgi:serine/threonine-protein kinase RsbW
MPEGSSGAAEGDPLFHARIEADAAAVSAAVIALGEALARTDLCEDLRIDVELVAAEAMNNVVEHAYREGGSGWLEILVEMAASGPAIGVVDGGRPLPVGLLGPIAPDGCGVTPAFEGSPSGRTAVEEPDEMAEGGFGWQMIRSCAAAICYERTEGMNRLRIEVGRA